MHSTKVKLFFIVLILMQHNGCYADCKGKEKPSFWGKLKDQIAVTSEDDWFTYGLKTAVVGGTVIVAAPAVAAVAGFGTAGVAAGSAAAAVQATWFGGAITGYTGMVFSALQSIGAAGLGAGAKTAVVAGTGATLRALGIFSEAEDDNNKEDCDEKPPDNNKHSVEF